MSMKSNTAKKKSKLKKEMEYGVGLLFNFRKQKLHRILRQSRDLNDDNRRVILNL